MTAPAEAFDTVLDEHDAALAQAAQRCMMAALDHSRAATIKLVAEGEDLPAIELPPKALRLVAELLGLMGQRRPVTLLPQKHELSTQEAAAFLNVSRPFVVKQIETGRLPARKVGRHRRVLFEDLLVYQLSLRQETEQALQTLADEGQELGI
ncbi:MAG: helix-turn-helix domain-containing protein [Ectothiorhodospiraceae bacterium]|jgi:excisionase family DNA binding protein|nr:helix-turn-helix domain-containing protein [Ectothiorhodospiraceae bacterium]